MVFRVGQMPPAGGRAQGPASTADYTPTPGTCNVLYNGWSRRLRPPPGLPVQRHLLLHSAVFAEQSGEDRFMGRQSCPAHDLTTRPRAITLQAYSLQGVFPPA